MNIFQILAIILIISSCGARRSSNTTPNYFHQSLGTALPLRNALNGLDPISANLSTQFKLSYNFVTPAIIASVAEEPDTQSSVADSDIVGKDNVAFPSVMKSFMRAIDFSQMPFLSKITFGGEFERKLVERNGSQYFQRDFPNTNVVVAGVDFIPVNLGREYDEDTYQSVAVHTTHALNLTYSKIRPLLEVQDLPSAISLEIAPLIRTQIITDKWHDDKQIVMSGDMVNNAYYDIESKKIVMLPQGKTGDTEYVPFSGVALWKMPFVVSHEYGHHVFEEFTKLHEKIGQLDLCINNREVWELNYIEPLPSNRPLTNKFLLKSLHEAIADLVSAYTVQDEFPITLSAGCGFARRIDQESLSFSSLDLKKLNSSRWEKFENGVVDSLYCGAGVNHQDTHILGASIAYTIDRILSSKLTTQATSAEKLRALLAWIKTLKGFLSDSILSQSPKFLLTKMMENLGGEDLSAENLRIIMPMIQD